MLVLMKDRRRCTRLLLMVEHYDSGSFSNSDLNIDVYNIENVCNSLKVHFVNL